MLCEVLYGTYQHVDSCNYHHNQDTELEGLGKAAQREGTWLACMKAWVWSPALQKQTQTKTYNLQNHKDLLPALAL